MAGPIDNGSRICDENRVALTGIDLDYTLTGLSQRIIYAASSEPPAGTVYINNNTHTLQYRTGSDTFAVVPATSSSVPSMATAAALTHNTAVASADRRCTLGPKHIASAKEAETANGLNYGEDVAAGKQTEAQWGLTFTGCPNDVTYEFRVEWEYDGGAGFVTYGAQITTPAAPPPPSAPDLTPIFQRRIQEMTQ